MKPIPSNVKELQSFLGFMSYYRQHIKDYASISSCLTKLLSVNTAFEINKERIDSYNSLKKELTSSPVLFHPDPTKPYKPYVDASMEGLGAALQPTNGDIFLGLPRLIKQLFTHGRKGVAAGKAPIRTILDDFTVCLFITTRCRLG